MARLILLISSLFLWGSIAFSQNSGNDSLTRNDLGFINYLIGKSQYDDAIYVLEKHILKPGLTPNTHDTLNHLLGWSYYSVKQLDASSAAFDKVSRSSASYLKARFFSSYNQTFLGNYSRSAAMLDSLELPEPWQKELQGFQMAGISLLKRDTAAFRKYAGSFTNEFYSLATEEQSFRDYSTKISQFRKKSNWKAAVISAVIPGLGKVYARKLGEGISSFIIVTALGAVAFENYRKDGLTDVKTLFFGTMFGIYYVGNIWGSAIAAQRHNNQFYYEINQKVLLDLHIPLRTIFN